MINYNFNDSNIDTNHNNGNKVPADGERGLGAGGAVGYAMLSYAILYHTIISYDIISNHVI